MLVVIMLFNYTFHWIGGRSLAERSQPPITKKDPNRLRAGKRPPKLKYFWRTYAHFRSGSDKLLQIRKAFRMQFAKTHPTISFEEQRSVMAGNRNCSQLHRKQSKKKSVPILHGHDLACVTGKVSDQNHFMISIPMLIDFDAQRIFIFRSLQ